MEPLGCCLEGKYIIHQTANESKIIKTLTIKPSFKICSSFDGINHHATVYLTDCMFLSCHVRVSEQIHTLYLPKCQVTPCSKLAQYLKFK